MNTLNQQVSTDIHVHILLLARLIVFVYGVKLQSSVGRPNADHDTPTCGLALVGGSIKLKFLKKIIRQSR